MCTGLVRIDIGRHAQLLRTGSGTFGRKLLSPGSEEHAIVDEACKVFPHQGSVVGLDSAWLVDGLQYPAAHAVGAETRARQMTEAASGLVGRAAVGPEV